MLDGCANDIVVMVKCGGVYGAALESERRERHQREQQVGRRWDQGAAEHHRSSFNAARGCGIDGRSSSG